MVVDLSPEEAEEFLKHQEAVREPTRAVGIILLLLLMLLTVLTAVAIRYFCSCFRHRWSLVIVSVFALVLAVAYPVGERYPITPRHYLDGEAGAVAPACSARAFATKYAWWLGGGCRVIGSCRKRRWDYCRSSGRT